MSLTVHSLLPKNQMGRASVQPTRIAQHTPVVRNTPVHFGAKTVQTQESVAEVLKKLTYRDGFFFVAHGDQKDGVEQTPTTMDKIKGWAGQASQSVVAWAEQSHLDKKPGLKTVVEKLAKMGEPQVSVQVQFMAPDSTVPGSEPTLRTGARKWAIRPDATPGQIAQTVFMALLAVEEHELREGFLFDHKRIFNPHHNIDKMVAFLKDRAGKPTEPDSTHDDTASVQSLFDRVQFQNYKLKVDSVTPVDATKQVVIFELQDDPFSGVKTSGEYVGKKITYVTGKSKTRLIRNLLDALIEEQRKEVRDKFKFDTFPMFGNDVPISHLEEYTKGKKF